MVIEQLTVRTVWATHHRWVAGQQWHLPPSAYALWLVLRGAVVVRSQRRQWQLTAGSAFLFPPHQERFIVTPNGAEWLSVGLDAQLFGCVDFLAHLAPPVTWQPDEEGRRWLQTWMEQIVRLFPPQTDAAHLVVTGLAKALVGLCWQMVRRTGWRAVSDALLPHWLSAVLQRIQETPQVTVTELARHAHFSPAQFRRLFRAWVGMAPRTYLRHHRLSLARQLLALTDLPIAAVAARCGFDNPSHFSRAFKRAFGIAPTAYRQGAKETGEIASRATTH